MRAAPRRGFAFVLLLALASSARAADEDAVVTRSAALLDEIASDPECGIPPQFLREAQGIMIMPRTVETELGVGRIRGRGVFLRRQDDGAWGNPEVVTLRGGSVGGEAGRMVSDTVTIYRTRKAADASFEGRLVLGFGVEFSMALRPRHTYRGPGPESTTRADVLVYKRKRGMLLRAGIFSRFRSPLAVPSTASEPAADQATPIAPPTGTVADSPAVAGLKTVLTSLTTPAPSQVAATPAKDPQVRPTSGTQRGAATATPTPRQ